MASEAVNLNPHYEAAERHPDAASSDFVAACYFLAFVLPAVGFWMGFALLFKHREGHGPVVMVIACLTTGIWAWVYYKAFFADLGDASFTFD
jgi:hypothetical protein